MTKKKTTPSKRRRGSRDGANSKTERDIFEPQFAMRTGTEVRRM
jgi:hypothetical protein